MIKANTILRKNMVHHIDDECMEKVLICSNDECKEEIKRKDFKNHIESECEYRIIECEYVKFGCNYKGIKANEMEMHLKEYQIQHLNHKFDFIVKQVYNTHDHTLHFN